MNPTRVRIFYPADPVGIVPGGIDTFIRGMIKSAPADVVISLVGMSTDAQRRPPGVWTTCHIDGQPFEFFPVLAVADAGQRERLPLVVRFMAGLWRHREVMRDGFDVIDLHRIEPTLFFLRDHRPRNMFFHQDPSFLRLDASDNLWRRLPAAYEWLEARIMARVHSAWCVRESGVQVLRQRYPALARQTHFVPTWVDTSVFSPVNEAERAGLRTSLAQAWELDTGSRWVISVGRLDTQKNPQRLLQSIAHLKAEGQRLTWLVVGDGVLRPELDRLVAQAGIQAQVCFLGLQSTAQISQWLRAADVFALPSAYEGMPMALLEALGSGLPAAVTDVGEVRRVVQSGVNGSIATAQTDDAWNEALREVLTHADTWRGAPARDAIEPYQPERVLAPVYDNHRMLARMNRRTRATDPAVQVPRTHRVIGVPVHGMDRSQAVQRIMAWARRLESRYVCFCNVHSAVLASTQATHRQALESADLVAPDGAPIAWTLSVKRGQSQERVDGPDTMLALCEAAAQQGVRIGLLGSTDEVLALLKERLCKAYPGLQVAYSHSPPFRAQTAAEEQQVCDDIRAQQVGLLFVGLGCPKQETWMQRHRGRIPAVMLGVGAAFDFHAGTVQRAPDLLQTLGLEWLHRLASEPRRLWWRYLSFNTQFVCKSALDLARILMRRSKALISQLVQH